MLNTNSQLKFQEVPRLRFKNFTSKWDKKKLGDIAKFYKGSGIAKDDVDKDGKNKCIRYGELYTNYNEVINVVLSKTNILKTESFLSKKNDVLNPSSGETPLDIARFSCVNEDEVLLGGDLNVLRLDDNQSGIFFAYYLSNYQKRNIARLSQGHSVVHLYESHLKKLSIKIPYIQEQQKVASFLSSVDEWIENLKKQKLLLGVYKKGMTQKIFLQKIRFKDDNGNDFPKWEERKLEDCLEYEQPANYIVHNTEYKASYKIPVLTAGKTFILGYTNEADNIFINNLPVIIFDDFTTASQYVNFPFKVKSSAMKILKSKKDTNIKFLFEAIQQIKYNVGGHGRHWISKYSKIKIFLPNISEQQKIANFLSTIDNLIDLKEQQISKLGEWKKGLMEQMFV